MRKYLKTILLIWLCFSGGLVSAQNITLTTGNESKPLQDIIATIEKQSDFLFVYDNTKIDVQQQCRINVHNKTVNEILDILFRDNQTISYEINKKNIILKRVPVQKKTNPAKSNVRHVKGHVMDINGTPVVGAVVQVNGANIGGVVDIDGFYELTGVPLNSKLVVSCMSYETTTVVASKDFTGEIVMQEDAEMLEEVVVVGYGTLERKEITSSIVSLSSDDMMQGVGGSDITRSLQGKVPGLVIAQTKGVNDDPSMQMRGMASITAGQEPLVVIDGFPGGDIRSINPYDIKSIDILKDASAGAIYGTRAAAGVILITTKNGYDTEGKLNLTYSTELSHKQGYRKPDVLSAEEYVKYGVGKDYGSKTDWWDECINHSNFSHKHNLSLNFGTKKASIYSSVFYDKQAGLAKDENREDFGGRINSKYTLFKGWLDIRLNVDYRQTKRNKQGPRFGQALLNNPTRSPYDSESRTGFNIWTGEPNDYNMIADAKLYDNNELEKWFKPEAALKLNVLPVEGLVYQQTFGYSSTQKEIHTYKSMYHRKNILDNIKGTAQLGFQKRDRINTEGYFSYDREFDGVHKINAVLGYSYNRFDGEGFMMSNSNFSVDGIKYWDIGKGSFLNDGQAKMDSWKHITEKLLAYFIRANYSYKNRYIVSATYRREGSSKFGENNRWGNFWAVSAGWNIMQEPFMGKVSWMDDLKLRVGYGVTGNNDFSAAYSGKFIGADENRWIMPNGSWMYAYGRSEDVNPNLGWESKAELNVGIDFSFFKHRLYGKVDYFNRRISDMLFYVRVPQPPFIRGYQWQNIGVMTNEGFEIELGGDFIRTKNFTWHTDLNLSRSVSMVKKLDSSNTRWDGGELPGPNSPGKCIILENGSRIGEFFMYEFGGFNKNGEFLIINRNGQKVTSSSKIAEDRKLMGNFTPELMFGWNHTFTYKDFDLGINMHGWLGFDVLNTYTMTLGIQKRNGEANVLRDAFGKFSHIKDEKLMSNYYLEDGSFMKIDALTLGYTLNLNKYTDWIQRLRVFFTCGNLAILTAYEGLDPEVDIIGYTGGIDNYYNAYPLTRTYTFGLQLNF